MEPLRSALPSKRLSASTAEDAQAGHALARDVDGQTQTPSVDALVALFPREMVLSRIERILRKKLRESLYKVEGHQYNARSFRGHLGV